LLDGRSKLLKDYTLMKARVMSSQNNALPVSIKDFSPRLTVA
jgi:hypothetical protein